MPLKPVKQFLDYTQQLKKLSDKGLAINDTTMALTALAEISYYALISGYKRLFYNPMNRKYIPGAAFEDILSLYHFDKSLRELFFKFLCTVEQRVKSQLSYHFCAAYSVMQADYLDPAHYVNTKANRASITKLIDDLSYEANKSPKHPYIVYQRQTYGNVPLWVMMKALTFGQMSTMYSLLEPKIKTRISKAYKSVSESELAQHLKVLGDYRNVCAHNERLFTHRTRYEIPDTGIHHMLGIRQTGTQYIQGKKDPFAVVISLYYLLPAEEFTLFAESLSALIGHTVQNSLSLIEAALLDAMGFPKNWKSILSPHITGTK